MKALNTCDPEGIRTPDPQIRNLLLYPAELRDHSLFKKKGSNRILISRLSTAVFVGVAGFEPTTFCSQSRRDTGLRYTPK